MQKRQKDLLGTKKHELWKIPECVAMRSVRGVRRPGSRQNGVATAIILPNIQVPELRLWPWRSREVGELVFSMRCSRRKTRKTWVDREVWSENRMVDLKISKVE